MLADPAFQSALALYQQGRLDHARQACVHLVSQQPSHHHGLHLLGAITLQLGDVEDGLGHVRAAIAADPAQPAAYTTVVNALLQQRRAIEAVPYGEMAVRLSPGSAAAHNLLGATLRDAGRLQEALRSVDRALAIAPEHDRAHNNRGNILRDLQRPDEALAAYERALALAPTNLLAIDNRLRLLQSLGLAPAGDSAGALVLGDEHMAQGRAADALVCYQQHLRMHADDVAALSRSGTALLALRRAEEAALCFEHLLRLQPADAAAHNNLGSVCHALEQPERALQHFARATELAPHEPGFWLHHAQTLMGLDRHDEALPSLDRCLALAPEHPMALGTRVAAQRRVCDWAGLRERSAQLIDAVANGQPATSPFLLMLESDDPALQFACARRYAAKQFPASAPFTHTSVRHDDRIRVAYLSADFHGHATSHLMAGLFEHHDRSNFEIRACSFGPDRHDPMRERLVKAFDHFIDIRHLDDAAAAQLMRSQRIDIAVDLKGYTHLARSGILAQRAAPLQVSYLGFPGTLGTDFIDYIVADRQVIPPEQHVHYSERVVTLPGCYQANDATRAIAARRPGRAELGLPEQGFVFCCFNNSNKLGPDMFDVWMRLLQQRPGSVLWLLADFDMVQTHLRCEAAARGIDPQRLLFAARLPQAEHLARLEQADLFLDTLPYNAHTTTSDALWAGVPVLTCRGRGFAARVAASLLHGVGLPELVTDTLAGYEALALQLSAQPDAMAALRMRLAEQRRVAPLFDTERFCRYLEAAYRQMNERHRSGLAPEAFDVSLAN